MLSEIQTFLEFFCEPLPIEPFSLRCFDLVATTKSLNHQQHLSLALDIDEVLVTTNLELFPQDGARHCSYFDRNHISIPWKHWVLDYLIAPAAIEFLSLVCARNLHFVFYSAAPHERNIPLVEALLKRCEEQTGQKPTQMPIVVSKEDAEASGQPEHLKQQKDIVWLKNHLLERYEQNKAPLGAEHAARPFGSENFILLLDDKRQALPLEQEKHHLWLPPLCHAGDPQETDTPKILKYNGLLFAAQYIHDLSLTLARDGVSSSASENMGEEPSAHVYRNMSEPELRKRIEKGYDLLKPFNPDLQIL